MFRTEGSELIKGSMLALTIDAILDFTGERTGHFRLIISEVSSHDARARSAKVEAGFASNRALFLESAHDLVAKPRTPCADHALARRANYSSRSSASSRNSLHEVIGADWSDEIDAAWRKLLGDIESLVAAQ
jgi:hypothetical protein